MRKRQLITLCLGSVLMLSAFLLPSETVEDSKGLLSSITVSAEALPNNSSNSSSNSSSKNSSNSLNANGYKDGDYIDANTVFNVENIPDLDADTSGIGDLVVWFFSALASIAVYVAMIGLPILMVLHGSVDILMFASPILCNFITTKIPIQLCSNEACKTLGVTYSYSAEGGGGSAPAPSSDKFGWKAILSYVQDQLLKNVVLFTYVFLLFNGTILKVTNMVVNYATNFIMSRL